MCLVEGAGIADVSDPGYDYKLHVADHGRGCGVGRGLGDGVASASASEFHLATAIDVKHDVHVRETDVFGRRWVGNPQSAALR